MISRVSRVSIRDLLGLHFYRRFIFVVRFVKVRYLLNHRTAPFSYKTVWISPPSTCQRDIDSIFFSSPPTDSDRPITHVIPRSKSTSGRGGSVNLGRSHHSAVIEDIHTIQVPDSTSKSSTLPGNRSRDAPPSPSHLAVPGFPYRPPSPEPPGKKAGHKRSLFRRRAESMDTYRIKSWFFLFSLSSSIIFLVTQFSCGVLHLSLAFEQYIILMLS